MNKRYKCSYCDKTYASRQGKSRHQKTCINKPINTEEQLVNLNIENNNIEIENLDVHVIDQNNNSESVVKTANESDNKEDEDPILEEDIKDMKYFGMEDTSFLSSEELLNSIKKPYTMVNSLLFKIYFEKNRTVSSSNIDDTNIRVLKNNKWSYMKKEECFLDMIDRTYNEMDMFFTYEGGADKLSEEEKKNYQNFQKYYDDDNMNLKKKLCEDIEKILKNKTNNLLEVHQNC
tara:strand:+ start:5192 stop:5890 length:699 start_codon:yes stop_codon:yes gene_type:complete